jgi:protein transport protein SEC24
MHETDVDLAVLDPDKSMVAEMMVDGKTREGAAAVFQCALMYTRSDGIRVLRIHTVSLPTTPKLPEVSERYPALHASCSPAECNGLGLCCASLVGGGAAGNALCQVFRFTDGDALAVVLAKRTVAHVKQQGFDTSNSMIRNTLVDILACYRRDCAINPATGQVAAPSLSPLHIGMQSHSPQLILPDAIKALACQSVCFLKSPGLRPNSGISTDYRVSLLDRFMSASIRETLIMMYPRLFPVHTLAEEDGVARPSDGSVAMPASVKTMQESLKTDGEPMRLLVVRRPDDPLPLPLPLPSLSPSPSPSPPPASPRSVHRRVPPRRRRRAVPLAGRPTAASVCRGPVWSAGQVRRA